VAPCFTSPPYPLNSHYFLDPTPGFASFLFRIPVLCRFNVSPSFVSQRWALRFFTPSLRIPSLVVCGYTRPHLSEFFPIHPSLPRLLVPATSCRADSFFASSPPVPCSLKRSPCLFALFTHFLSNAPYPIATRILSFSSARLRAFHPHPLVVIFPGSSLRRPLIPSAVYCSCSGRWGAPSSLPLSCGWGAECLVDIYFTPVISSAVADLLYQL